MALGVPNCMVNIFCDKQHMLILIEDIWIKVSFVNIDVADTDTNVDGARK